MINLSETCDHITMLHLSKMICVVKTFNLSKVFSRSKILCNDIAIAILFSNNIAFFNAKVTFDDIVNIVVKVIFDIPHCADFNFVTHAITNIAVCDTNNVISQ